MPRGGGGHDPPLPPVAQTWVLAGFSLLRGAQGPLVSGQAAALSPAPGSKAARRPAPVLAWCRRDRIWPSVPG